ncbi:MAG: hypothetical protein SF182_01575 [Deltaproteobacteria bacterium]|nr:hypothetical protein [Deltaproteobacteria bacterium]
MARRAAYLHGKIERRLDAFDGASKFMLSELAAIAQMIELFSANVADQAGASPQPDVFRIAQLEELLWRGLEFGGHADDCAERPCDCGLTEWEEQIRAALGSRPSAAPTDGASSPKLSDGGRS